jgi:hypothetical protein
MILGKNQIYIPFGDKTRVKVFNSKNFKETKEINLN